jgi:type VI secretion system protein ImpH
VSVLDRLASEAAGYHFFQAVRLVQDACPGAVQVGHQGPVEREVLRFRAHLSLGFPASDLVDARPSTGADGARRWEFTISFLGLYGPSSPLPNYFTEALLAREDKGLTRGFLDLFHHRLASLAYRSWAKYHPESSSEETKRLRARLALLIDGASSASPELPLERLLTHLGTLSRTAPSAHAVAQLLTRHFAVPVAIEQCLARWTAIPAEARSLLGRSGRLGRDSVAGRNIFNRTTAFALSLGPLTPEEFSAFLPSGARHREFAALVRRLNPDQLDCQVSLLIAAADLPASVLGVGGAALNRGARLGGRSDQPYRVSYMLMPGSALN